MNNIQDQNVVTMTRSQLAAEKIITIERALGELLIHAAEVIDNPAAMLSLAGVADKTYKQALEELGLN